MNTFDPNDDFIVQIRQRMVPGDQVAGLPRYPDDDIKKGDKFVIALPRWVSGDCGQQMYDICVATEDMEAKKDGVTFQPYVVADKADYELQCKTPLDAIHAMLAVKDIHDKMEKAIGNITASRVARTRLVKSESRLLTDWQTEIIEIMEANGVPEENIGKVLDLL